MLNFEACLTRTYFIGLSVRFLCAYFCNLVLNMLTLKDNIRGKAFLFALEKFYGNDKILLFFYFDDYYIFSTFDNSLHVNQTLKYQENHTLGFLSKE